MSGEPRSESAVFRAISSGKLAFAKRARRVIVDGKLVVLPPNIEGCASDLPPTVKNILKELPSERIINNEADGNVGPPLPSSDQAAVVVEDVEDGSDEVLVDDDAVQELNVISDEEVEEESRQRSPIYLAFTKIDAVKYKCRMCSSELQLTVGRTGIRNVNSNLHYHLRDSHYQFMDKANKRAAEEGTPIDKVVEEMLNEATKSIGQKRLTDFLTAGNEWEDDRKNLFLGWVYGTAIPPYAIDHPLFREFLSYRLNKEGKVIDRLSEQPPVPLSRNLLLGSMLDDTFKKVYDINQSAISRAKFFGVSFDGWLSQAGDNYMAINYYFVDEKWQYQSFLGDLVLIPDAHTGLHLAVTAAQRINTLVPGDAMLVGAVTDNAKNVLLAAYYLHHHLLDLANGRPIVEITDTEFEAADDEPYTFGCVNHRINLALKDVFEVGQYSISPIIERLRNILLHCKNNSEAKRRLKELTPLKPIFDVLTRWNSTEAMIKRGLQLYPFLYSMAKDKYFDCAGVQFLSQQDVLRLKQAQKILEIVKILSLYAEGQNHATMSGLAPRIASTLSALKEADGMGDEVKELAAKMHERLSARLGSLLTKAGICLVAAALDHHHSELTFVTEKVREDTWELIERWANELPPFEAEPLGEKDEYDKYLPQFQTDSNAIHLAVRKVREVLEKTCRDGNLKELSALEYWGKVVTKPGSPFLMIANVAQFALSLPPSSAESENSFSSAGIIVSERRTRLLPVKVEKLAVIRDFVRRNCVAEKKSKEKKSEKENGSERRKAAERYLKAIKF